MGKKEVTSMKTKKLLAPYDPQHPKKVLEGFLCPMVEGEEAFFINIDTGEEWEQGLVVFIGEEITEADLFARIVDEGYEIESVQELVELLKVYIGEMGQLKVGNIVAIEPDSLDPGFRLRKLAEKAPNERKRRLP